MDNVLDLLNALNGFAANMTKHQSVILVCVDTDSMNVVYSVNGSPDALSYAISTPRTEMGSLTSEQLLQYSAVQNTILKMALEMAKEDKIIATKFKKELKKLNK